MNPKDMLNLKEASTYLGMDERALRRVYRTFNTNATEFREESERHGG